MTGYHLWRQYDTAPYYRWAAEVKPDPEAPDGYVVLRSDPIVADTAFYHRLAAAMNAGHEALTMRQDGGKLVHSATPLPPGSEEHFETAIRRVNGAVLGQSPEYMAKLNGSAA